MNKQELKDKIGKQMERNMYYMTAVSTNASTTRELGNNIKLLQEISIQMAESDEAEYNRGLNDAWELARKICCFAPSGYAFDELTEIFGPEHKGTATTMENHTYHTALTKVQEYEKKKAEEAARPVIGDVVKVVDNGNPYNVYNGIYLGSHNNVHYIQERSCCAPSCFSIDHFTLTKTGQHVNLEGWSIDD